MKQAQKLFQEIGLEPERVHMFNMSAAMAGAFVDAVNQRVDKVKELGPNPLRRMKDGG